MTDMAVVHERALRSRGEVPTARHRGGDLPGAIAAPALPTRHRSATERMPEGVVPGTEHRRCAGKVWIGG